jgi:hypothetical protein
MRIWDLPVELLCRQHLLGEHRELHGLWNIYVKGKKGYRNHPETRRWDGKLLALWHRHQNQVKEMKARGYNHKSDLGPIPQLGHSAIQMDYINTPEEQVMILREKGCECKVWPDSAVDVLARAISDPG